MTGSLESRCPLCGGNKKQGRTTFSADLGNGVVVVRNVPAMVCDQCGEAWLDPTMAKRLELMGEEAKDKGMQVEVVAL